MGRRIWIIPSTRNKLKTQKEINKARNDAVDLARQDAILSNCPEIAWGIPPVLAGVIDGASLPIAFEEPESSPPEQPRDPLGEIDKLKTKIEALEKR